MKQLHQNLIKLWFSDAAYAAASAVSTGSVFSAFLMHGGMTEGQIGLYLSITQLVNLAVSLLFAGAAANTRDTRKPLLLLGTLSATIIALHLCFCFSEIGGGIAYSLILLLGCLQAAVTALRTVFIYKLPCEVMDLRYYSLYAGYQGLFTGAAGIGIGFVLPLFFERFSFAAVNAAAFVFAGICAVISAILLRILAPLTDGKTNPKDTAFSDKKGISMIADLRRLLHNRLFMRLLLPNILRGFGTGLISIFPVVVLREQILSEQSASLLTAGTYIGTLFSCFAYVFCVKRLGVPKTCLLGGVLFSIICLTLFGGTTFCLVLYTLAYVGFNIVCCAVPDLIYRSVGSDLISIFQTWRLTMTQLGVVLASALFGLLIEWTAGILIVLIGVICYLICAGCYYLDFKNNTEFGIENRKKGTENEDL